MAVHKLIIDAFETLHALSSGTSMSLFEAARVCLERHHVSPVTFQIDGLEKLIIATLEWPPTDQRIQASWKNEIDATEEGAYACILAAVELLEGLIAIGRAETKTGADFYVAPPGTEYGDLENTIRLEVSGTDRGSASRVASLLREKLNQAKRGDSNLPAMAGVLGFKILQMRLARLEKS